MDERCGGGERRADACLRQRGAYVKAGTDVQEEALKGGAGREQRGGEGSWGRAGAGDAWTPLPTEPGDYAAFYAGVAAALRGRGPTPVDPADAVGGLRVLEAARRSARDGTVVRLGER